MRNNYVLRSPDILFSASLPGDSAFSSQGERPDYSQNVERSSERDRLCYVITDQALWPRGNSEAAWMHGAMENSVQPAGSLASRRPHCATMVLSNHILGEYVGVTRRINEAN